MQEMKKINLKQNDVIYFMAIFHSRVPLPLPSTLLWHGCISEMILRHADLNHTKQIYGKTSMAKQFMEENDVSCK